jgi:hypothetical protein
MDPEDSTPQIEDRNIIEALASYSEFLLDCSSTFSYLVILLFNSWITIFLLLHTVNQCCGAGAES